MTSRLLPQDYELVEIERLRPHPDNPRQGDVGAIHESIEANGFYGALVVQRSSAHVLVGNHRLQAALHAGENELPVIWVDVDDDRARRIMLADNRSGDLASYDESRLVELLEELALGEGGLEGTGWDGDELDRLLRDAEPPEGFKEVDETIDTQYACPKCGYEWSGASS
jgi:ParB-like chromosome segregation protein Spo0J